MNKNECKPPFTEEQNLLKIETLSSSKPEDNDESLPQHSFKESNGEIKFSCRCGKQYSRNASLFNHIRIKHENNIGEWKVFEGMRKQGRPKKEQIQELSSQINQQKVQETEIQESLLSKTESINNKEKLLNSKGLRGNVFGSNQEMREGSKNNFGSIDKFNSEYSIPQQIANQNQIIQHPPFLPPPPSNFPLYPPYLHDRNFLSEQPPPSTLTASPLQHPTQNSSFLNNLVHNQEDQCSKNSIAIDILVKFREIQTDPEAQDENQDLQYLQSTYEFQEGLFTQYQMKPEDFRNYFHGLYPFLKFWMRYIRKDKILETFQEYLKFQFAKMTKVNIESTPTMKKFQQVYDDFEKRQLSLANSSSNSQKQQGQYPYQNNYYAQWQQHFQKMSSSLSGQNPSTQHDSFDPQLLNSSNLSSSSIHQPPPYPYYPSLYPHQGPIPPFYYPHLPSPYHLGSYPPYPFPNPSQANRLPYMHLQDPHYPLPVSILSKPYNEDSQAYPTSLRQILPQIPPSSTSQKSYSPNHSDFYKNPPPTQQNQNTKSSESSGKVEEK